MKRILTIFRAVDAVTKDKSYPRRDFHRSNEASEGMRQSPRGESDTVPTFGPSVEQLRLNCCVKNRRRNVFR